MLTEEQPNFSKKMNNILNKSLYPHNKETIKVIMMIVIFYFNIKYLKTRTFDKSTLYGSSFHIVKLRVRI